MGAAAIPVALIAGSAISGAIAGAHQPTPYQPRQPFTRAANANDWMGGLHDMLSGSIDAASHRINAQPLVTAPDLPAYQPHFAGATPQPGTTPNFLSPSSSGPQRRPISSSFPAAAPAPANPFGGDPSTTAPMGAAPMGAPAPTDPNGMPRDFHAARLALMALSGQAA